MVMKWERFRIFELYCTRKNQDTGLWPHQCIGRSGSDLYKTQPQNHRPKNDYRLSIGDAGAKTRAAAARANKVQARPKWGALSAERPFLQCGDGCRSRLPYTHDLCVDHKGPPGPPHPTFNELVNRRKIMTEVTSSLTCRIKGNS